MNNSKGMYSNRFYIIWVSFIAAIGGFLLGFDGSVISGAVPFYKSVFGLEDGSFMFGFSVSCIIWGSILGNLFAGPLSDRIGRKPSLLIAAFLFTATGLLCAFAGTIEVFILGRIVGGLGVGIAILVAPVYIAEIAPANKRGWLVSFNQLLIVIGLSAAYFSNYLILQVVEDPLMNWRWMLGVEIFPAILYFISVLFIPESPRWLIMNGQIEKAQKILVKVHGAEQADIELKEINESARGVHKASFNTQAKELWSSKLRKPMIIGLGLGILQQFSGINAILYYAPIVFESAGGGRDAAFMQAIILGIVFVIMTIVSMFLIDRLGRKPLLYAGVGIMAVSLSVTGILFGNARYQLSPEQIRKISASKLKADIIQNNRDQTVKPADYQSVYFENGKAFLKNGNATVRSIDIDSATMNKLLNRSSLFTDKTVPLAGKIFDDELSFQQAFRDNLQGSDIQMESYQSDIIKEGIQINSFLVLLSILGFIAGFSISLGPVMWALFSEIFPNHLRGLAISIVGAVNAVSSFLVATFFPIQLAKIGSSGTYFIYAGFMFFCLWFVWKYVVETKGKTLEQLEKDLTNPW